MIYREFVKQQMQLLPKTIPAPERLKIIGKSWQESKSKSDEPYKAVKRLVKAVKKKI